MECSHVATAATLPQEVITKVRPNSWSCVGKCSSGYIYMYMYMCVYVYNNVGSKHVSILYVLNTHNPLSSLSLSSYTTKNNIPPPLSASLPPSLPLSPSLLLSLLSLSSVPLSQEAVDMPQVWCHQLWKVRPPLFRTPKQSGQDTFRTL